MKSADGFFVYRHRFFVQANGSDSGTPPETLICSISNNLQPHEMFKVI